jgi:peptidoglycan/LPS O-acetylase OafA/YrhL
MYSSHHDQINNNVSRDRAFVDELKGISIIFICFYHSNNYTLFHGSIGVDTFLILSGYCAVINDNHHYSIQKFVKRKFFLTILYYWVSLLTLATAAIWILNINISYHDIEVHLLMIHGFVGYPYTINGAYWYMSLLLVCYVAFLLVRGMIRRNDAALTMMVGMAFTFILTSWFDYHHSFDEGSIIGIRVIDFFAGIGFAVLFRNKTVLTDVAPWKRSALYFSVLAFLTWDAYEASYSPSQFHEIFWFPWFGLAIFLGYRIISPLAPTWAKTVLSAFGALSYGIYLWHQPLMGDYMHYLEGLFLDHPLSNGIYFHASFCFGVIGAASLTMLYGLASAKLSDARLPQFRHYAVVVGSVVALACWWAVETVLPLP